MKSNYWLTICAQDHAIVPLHSCTQVRLISGVILGNKQQQQHNTQNINPLNVEILRDVISNFFY